VLVVLAVAAPALAVSGLVSNGANNAGPGDPLHLAIGVTHAGAPVSADVYLILVIPGGTPVFFTVGPGGIGISPTPAPFLSSVTLPDGLNTGLIPFLDHQLTGAEPTGLYQTVLVFTVPGTTTPINVTAQPFLVVTAPIGPLLGTYTGSWTNQTFGSTGPATITVTDTAAGVITISSLLGGNVFGQGPTSFTVPVSIHPGGGTVNTMTSFGPLTSTASANGTFSGLLTFNPGGPIATMTFNGSVANGLVQLTYTIAFRAGGSADGILTATHQ
jgi:hypothetical protein